MKLTKLLPITAIASLVAIVTPGVVSCSCTNPDRPDPVEPTEPFDCEVNDYQPGGMVFSYIATQDSQAFDVNKEYTFTIDFNDWDDFESPPKYLELMFVVGEGTNVGSIGSITLGFDHEKGVEGTDYVIKQDQSTAMAYVDGSDTTSIIKKDSVLTGRFEVASNVETAYLLTRANRDE